MRIALAQINTTIGAFAANLEAVRTAAQQAAREGARLLVAPELTVTGYPPRDFLEHADFVQGANAALEAFLRSDLPAGLALLIGVVEPHTREGAGLYNGAVLIDRGRIVARARKCLLPTYDVFDEGRYFDPATGPTLAELDGVRIGITICEDLWNDKLFWPHRRYQLDPMDELARQGAQMVVNLSASPYAIGKPALRERMVASAAARHHIPVTLTNLVGANDALVFDGRSFALDATGKRIAEAPPFREALVYADVEPSRDRPIEVTTPGEGVTPVASPARGESSMIVTPLAQELSASQLDDLHEALVLGTRDYAAKTGFRSAVLGLSGGADSALVAVVAAHALGPEKVTTVAMPSRFTADMSNDDAHALATRLGVHHLVLPIEKPFAAYVDLLAAPFAGRPWDVTEENLQARIRGAILMALSNKRGDLLLTTGNKSEIATGYCTLYGDMCGGLAIIGDLPKTIVYALCFRLNERDGREVIPTRILTRPPSAELRANQTDQDSLPPYEVLDRVLRRYIEARESADGIAAHEPEIPRAIIDRVISLVRRNEYKRRQAAPVLRVTPRAFGEGWRFPIAHGVR
jgi:NAD+ synthase (glutamine-hydrolysing)